ncbi:hypothetical protein KBA73_04035 [Patescibacteria group bacterium]|nr:hypothetical protein [Patescibacteria group bacterium]
MNQFDSLCDSHGVPSSKRAIALETLAHLQMVYGGEKLLVLSNDDLGTSTDENARQVARATHFLIGIVPKEVEVRSAESLRAPARKGPQPDPFSRELGEASYRSMLRRHSPIVVALGAETMGPREMRPIEECVRELGFGQELLERLAPHYKSASTRIQQLLWTMVSLYVLAVLKQDDEMRDRLALGLHLCSRNIYPLGFLQGNTKRLLLLTA